MVEPYCIDQVNFPNVQKAATGFKTAGRYDNYYVKMRGTLMFPESGDWEIIVKGAEGVRISLEDILVINDEKAEDGFKEFNTPLESRYNATKYRLKIDYFQAKGQNVGLELYWKGPSMSSKEIIPKSAYTTP